MTTQAHGPGSSTVSGAKLGVYGGIATALITAVGSIIVAMMNHHDVVPVSNDKTMSAASNESTWTTITPRAVSQGSDQGPVDRYAINDSRTEVKVWGHADKGVDGVFLLIGPKPSAGGYWLAFPRLSSTSNGKLMSRRNQKSRQTSKYGPSPTHPAAPGL